MEFVGNGPRRKGIIEIDGHAAALDRAKALLFALQCWNGETPPDPYTLFCISDLITELMPSEEDCVRLDQYDRQLRPENEE